MKRNFYLLPLVFIGLAFSVQAQETMSAKNWLEHMSQALRQEQFKVSAICIQGENITPIIYLHGKFNDHEVAFWERLNGPQKNRVRVNDTVTYLEHNQPAYSIQSNRIQGIWPAALSEPITDLENGYKFVLGGRSRIAGRLAQLVRLIPQDGTRYSHQVWIDIESYLPLRYDLVNQEKQPIEQVMVLELYLLQSPPHLLEQVAKQNWPEVMNRPGEQTTKNWQFLWLPQGFKLMLEDHHHLIGSGESVDYIGLSDGLVGISVYVSKAPKNPLPKELLTRNGLSFVSSVRDGYEVVAMGKIPLPTLARIANSLQLEP